MAAETPSLSIEQWGACALSWSHAILLPMHSSSVIHTPIRAIVTRFSYPMSRVVMENVLREVPFAFCGIISEGTEPHFFASLPTSQQEWFVSAQIRGCHYEGVDWDTLAPIDEELMEQLRDTEAIFMDAIARIEWKRSISYAARKRWYIRHVQFWNDYLTRNKINLYLSAWIPHELPDILLYRLCRLRGIPTLYFHTSLVRDISFAEHAWEDPAPRLRDRYQELLQQYARSSRSSEISLGALFEERYRSLITEQGQRPAVEGVCRPTEFDDIKELFRNSPWLFLRRGIAHFTFGGILRALGTLHRRGVIRARNVFYNTHAIEPDLHCPFVYFPLHFQPEASTTPMAGCFTDQFLIAQMLNACLPDGVLIYIKEHPRESAWVKRCAQDYQDFLSLSKVRLIARHVDTFTLRERCRAVATCTGSAGFEALFRCKPVLLFGNRFYQYVRGVFRIRTVDDCRHAVHAIFEEGVVPNLIDSRIFLKAMEEVGVRGLLNPWHLKVTGLSYEEHVEGNTKAILQELQAMAGGRGGIVTAPLDA